MTLTGNRPAKRSRTAFQVLRVRALKILRSEPQPSPSDVAKALGVHRATVSKWAQQAGIKIAHTRGRKPKHPEGPQTQYWYALPPTVHQRALDAILAQGLNNVADLLDGIASGAVEIRRTGETR